MAGASQLALLGLSLQLSLQQEQALMSVLQLQIKRKKRSKTRKYWVKPWLTRRLQYGMYHTLMRELERESGDFVSLMRMEPEMFREILMRVSERIRKQTTKFRKSLESGLKLAITLRHLATGESYHSLAFAFRVPHNTISLLIREVCQQITEEFQDLIATPKTTFEWKQIAQVFSSKWQFNHCLGALDGKHVAITCPQNSGSVFHNYKGYFSIILACRCQLQVYLGGYWGQWINV